MLPTGSGVHKANYIKSLSQEEKITVASDITWGLWGNRQLASISVRLRNSEQNPMKGVCLFNNLSDARQD